MNDYWLHFGDDDLINMSHVTAIRRLDNDDEGNIVIEIHFTQGELRTLTWRFKELNGKVWSELDDLNPLDFVRGNIIPVQGLNGTDPRDSNL